MIQSVRMTSDMAGWIPHDLNSDDRQLRAALSYEMIPVPEDRCKRSCKTIVTARAILSYFLYHHPGKWTIGLDDQDPVLSRGPEQRKVMLTAISPPGGFHVVNLLPEKMTMNSASFIGHILQPLARDLYLQGGLPDGVKVQLHLDNSRVDNFIRR
jgi:hypothetical protein